MILTVDQIKSIIKENPNRTLVAKGGEYSKKMRLHLYGAGLKESVELIENVEGKDLHKLRQKYCKSNKDLFSRLGRPIDKVFSARGGSVYYNLPESQDKKARSLALDIRNGFSVRKWIENFWKPHMLDDPFGMVFMEILPLPEAMKAKNEGRSVAYPTYKSITSIYDYLPKGAGVEYVVFNVSTSEKKQSGINPERTIYRVVDDSFDYYVEKKGEDVEILTDFTFPNYFGEVPAIINSDIIDPQEDDCYLSFFDDVIELADNFFLKGSVKLTHEFLHGFPKYWEYADGCGNCGGTGFSNSETCTTCKGTGKSLMLKVSDAKLLQYPSGDDVVIAPNVAGYVSPDKTYWEIATNDLQMLEEVMNVTLWGASSKVKTQGLSTEKESTATEEMLDIKPEADRLKTISEMAEKRHKFILDKAIKISLNMNYQGASVNYGRRYIMETPDAIWEKYTAARIKGNPVSVLEDLLIEYYEAKYQGDEVSLAIALKLMYVEPFVHATMQQVDASASITMEDKAAKAYFTEWLSTVNEAMILSFDVALLKEQLNAYAGEKAKAVQERMDKEVKQVA